MEKTEDQQSKINSVESGFSKIKDLTHCPFAEQSKIEYFDDWNPEKDFNENILSLSKQLESFTNRCESGKLDGFVFEISGDLCPKTIEGLSKMLKDILLKLNILDPQKSDCMNQDISASSWQFIFNRQRIFVNVFAPFYNKSNSRYSMSVDSVFVFLQPESSFDLHIINPAKSTQTVQLKENIRNAFIKGGNPYDFDIAKNPSDALKYIMPVNIGDAPIEWWK